MSKWIGRNLGRLTLTNKRGRESSPSSTSNLPSMLQHTKETLRFIQITEMVFNDEESLTFESIGSFPNLRILSLFQVDRSIYKNILLIDLPTLHQFVIVAREEDDQTAQAAFDGWLNTVQRYSSNLTNLCLRFSDSQSPVLPSQRPDLNFDQVTSLDLGKQCDHVGRWLAEWKWPELTDLESNEILQRIFKEKAPKLKLSRRWRRGI